MLIFFLGEFLLGQKISVEEDMAESPSCKSPAEVLYQTRWEDSRAKGDEDEEEKHFCMLMESLGANSVFEEWVLRVCACMYVCAWAPVVTEFVVGSCSYLCTVRPEVYTWWLCLRL